MRFHWVLLHEVRVDGIPKAQPRARSRKGQVGVHDPGDADDWKTIVRQAFKPLRSTAPMDEPLRIDVDWYLPRPQTFTKKTRLAYGGKSKDIPTGPVLHLSLPDLDNLYKAPLDALKDLGYFRNDSLVCQGELRKFYHAEGGRPGARFRVMVWRPVEE